MISAPPFGAVPSAVRERLEDRRLTGAIFADKECDWRFETQLEPRRENRQLKRMGAGDSATLVNLYVRQEGTARRNAGRPARIFGRHGAMTVPVVASRRDVRHHFGARQRAVRLEVDE